MSNFEDAVIQRIKQLEREVERLQRWERPTGGGGVTDHGQLTGLGDNDHPQYRLVSDAIDHGHLTGLADDDHAQYTKHPASSTDNAIARWDGTGGRTIQNSGVTIDDSNNIKVGTAPVPTSVTSSTDNAIVRFDGTGGNKIQNSSVAIDDNGKLSGDGLDGWIYDTDTWSYVSATSFKITGKDVRYRFPKGTKIKLVQSGATKYFYVIATAYSTDTTITITGGSDYSLANATISGQAYSYAAAPQNFPQWFNYTPTCYGWTSGTVTGIFKYSVIGNIVFLLIDMTAGTSNATNAYIDLPVNADLNASYGGTLGLAMDNGTVLTQATKWYIGGTYQTISFNTDMSNGAWTASGTKRVRCLAIYAKGT